MAGVHVAWAFTLQLHSYVYFGLLRKVYCLDSWMCFLSELWLHWACETPEFQPFSLSSLKACVNKNQPQSVCLCWDWLDGLLKLTVALTLCFDSLLLRHLSEAGTSGECLAVLPPSGLELHLGLLWFFSASTALFFPSSNTVNLRQNKVWNVPVFQQQLSSRDTPPLLAPPRSPNNTSKAQLPCEVTACS